MVRNYSLYIGFAFRKFVADTFYNFQIIACSNLPALLRGAIKKKCPKEWKKSTIFLTPPPPPPLG